MASPFIQSGIGHTLFSFDGRLTRRPFWLFGIAIPLTVVYSYSLVSDWVRKQEIGGAGIVDGIIQAANGIVLLALLTTYVWIFFAATVKRLHDRDMSGWWVWLFLIPYAGLLSLIVICVLPGLQDGHKVCNRVQSGEQG